MEYSRRYQGEGGGLETRPRRARYSYTAYGLQIQAELPLPELTVSAADEQPDITILFGDLSLPALELPEPPGRGRCVVNTPDGIYFYWEHFGAFLVREGREILIDPPPGISLQAVRLPLLGVVLGTLLHQRGLFTLHASAVALDGAAVAFLGAKRAGKSTMAAALHARGHAMIADDVVALDVRDADRALVLPGFPQFKLSPASVTALGGDVEALVVLHPQLKKRGLRPRVGFQQTRLPLKRIYVLSEGPSLSREPLAARDAFMQFVAHSYAPRFLGQAGAGPEHFRQCHRLVREVPVYRLQRPCDLAYLPSVARFIEDDCDTLL